MLRAVSGLDRVRLRLDRVRAAVGEIDPVFLDTPARSDQRPHVPERRTVWPTADRNPTACIMPGNWCIAGSPVLSTALPNAYWTKLGLQGFADPYRRFRDAERTARCGPARRVVWGAPG
jgi:hypothetical protein